MYLKFVVLVNAVVFVLSLCCVAFLPQVPTASVLLIVLVAVFMATVLIRRYIPALLPRIILPILIFISGVCYFSAYATFQLSKRLPDDLLGVEVRLMGVVTGLPDHNGQRLRFLCKTETLQRIDSGEPIEWNATLRLSWYGQKVPDLKAGNKVNLVVKLKPPSGFLNPGGFDNERWLQQKNITATGYVRSKSIDVSQSIVSNTLTPVASLRNHIQRRLKAAGAKLPSQGLVLALTVGDRSAVSKEQWDVFITTGTNHLLAISGLHISLVAGFFTLLVSYLWRFTNIASKATRQNSALIAGLAAATCYAAMAGFTVPTVRALLMFAVLACFVFARRHQRRVQGLAIAFIVVCIVYPLSVLAPGFWMSFAAVSVLYLVFSNAQRGGLWLKFIAIFRGHILITVGLYPLTLLFFQQASLVSPIANLVVTPLVGMVVTPLAFVAAVVSVLSNSVAAVILLVVDFTLQRALDLLAFFSALPLALIKLSGLAASTILLLCTAVILLLVPLSRSLRPLALVLVLPLFYTKSEALEPGVYRVVFLDVGQGTSVVVKTANHVMVYDTGDQFSSSFSAANAVVIPFLRAASINSIDKLVVSHADRDHSGGADELLDQLEVAELVISEPLPQRPEAKATQCRAGMSWTWDKVQFQVLHPQAIQSGSNNDVSCVLQISTPNGLRTLLPGDIESAGEQQLMQNNTLPTFAVVLAPHHGSATSSRGDLLDQLQAQYVVHSAGFQNRFGFPKPEVVARYAARNAQQFITAESGAVDFLIDDSRALIQVSEYRKTHKKWWHRRSQSIDDLLVSVRQ